MSRNNERLIRQGELKNGCLTELKVEMIQRRIIGNANHNEEEINVAREDTESLNDGAETAGYEN